MRLPNVQARGSIRALAALSALLASGATGATALAQSAPSGPHAPAQPQTLRSVRCAVIGDYGTGGTDEARVAALVDASGCDFVVTVGDNNYPSGAAATIDANIGQFYQRWIAPYTGAYGAGSATNRFWPCLGNHDWLTAGAAAYFAYFQLPGNERTYSFAQGPLRFWMLDSDPAEPAGITHASAQAQWLRAGLSAATEPFQVVCVHHAPYSSGEHGSNGDLQWPYREWGADLVISGHDHTYERLQIAGFPHVVDGLGGAAAYTFPGRVLGSQVRYNTDHGALLADARTDRLTLTFLTAGGFVQDQIALPADPAPQAQRFVQAGATWRYRDDGVDLGSAWRSAAYDDSAWPAGPAQLGYGDGDEATVVSYGPDPGNTWVTTYFRTSFACADPAALRSLVLEVLRDDGAAVYLNGREIARTNLPAGALAWSTLASAAVANADENAWQTFELAPALVLAGTNVLAVEVHQSAPASSDVSFDLRLTGMLRGTVLIAPGATWRYRDAGQWPGLAWTSLAFDDSGWAAGPAELGYGDGDEATVISFGPNPQAKPVTAWFRRAFQAQNPAAVRALGLRILADDGAAVYLNGVEVWRRNVPLDALDPAATTELALGPADEELFVETLLDPTALRAGTNVLAVELHQQSPQDDDAGFDLELVAY